ncbi:MAG: hypothetical protein A3H97_01030 [Acidobacteria bacterium RIFCSPLOWO2_02_FULL_65_29]|nr:MAG: hypothetical protein A3H97_01030 [Acidobacteria bacterium RIFCSPLOWO2_02_FULL_65_29]
MEKPIKPIRETIAEPPRDVWVSQQAQDPLKAASLTREGDEPVEAAVAAAKPREPAGEPSALKKVPELLLDESRQTVPVAETLAACTRKVSK